MTMVRRRRPAEGQSWFAFFTAAVPVYLDQPIIPAAVVAPGRTMRARRPVTPLHRQRLAGDRPGRSEANVERTVSRFVRRKAGCVLCKSWPACHDHLIGGRILLLCKNCEAKPSSVARLRELVTVDWKRTPASVRQAHL